MSFDSRGLTLSAAAVLLFPLALAAQETTPVGR